MQDGRDGEGYVQHLHAPPHLFRAGATYFITASTLDRVPVMSRPERRQQPIDSLLLAAAQRGWKRVAWVALPDHYHCIPQAPEDREPELSNLRSFYARLNYLHHNPVKHGLVAHPDEYPFSSYRIWRELEDVDLSAIEAHYPWDRLDLEFDLATDNSIT
jgi:putative transposase